MLHAQAQYWQSGMFLFGQPIRINNGTGFTKARACIDDGARNTERHAALHQLVERGDRRRGNAVALARHRMRCNTDRAQQQIHANV